MTILRPPFALVGALLLASTLAAGADRPEEIRRAAARAQVVHPGSTVRIEGELARRARPGRPGRGERDVVALGVLERDGAFAPLAVLGRRRVDARGRDPVASFLLDARVPRAAAPARLHWVLVLDDEVPREGAPDPASLARLGEVHVLEVVPAPNLSAGDLALVGEARVGEPLRVRWTARRAGAGPAGPAGAGVLLAEGAMPATGEAPWDGPFAPLDLARTAEAEGSTTFPAPRTPGPHTVRLRVAYDGEVDSDASDDERRLVVEVAPRRAGDRDPAPRPPPLPAPTPAPPPAPAPGPAPLANLVVVIPGRVETPVEPGAVVAVPYAVQNEGEGAAGAFSVTLRLVTTAGERLLDEEPVAGLPAGAQRRGRLRAEIPRDAPAGAGRLRVTVDPAGRVAESAEDDNVVEAPLVVARSRPNLVVGSVAARPPKVAPGETVRVAVVVRNVGPGASPASLLHLALARTGGEPVPLGEIRVPALEPGADAPLEASLVVPADAPALRWGLVARADPEDEIGEEDEDDNAAVVPGGLVTTEPAGAGVNLAVIEVTRALGAEVVPGETVVVRARIANTGRDVAPAFDLALVLATRERPERTRGGWRGVVSELARVTLPAGLRGGTEWVRELTGELPSGLAPGPYVLVVVADPAARVDDTARDDDMGALPVRLSGRPLLRVAAPGLTLDRESASPGEVVGGTAVLRNEGNEPSEPASVVLALAGAGPRRRPGIDAALASVPLDVLRPGAVRELSLAGALAPRLPPGRHRLVLRLVVPGADPVDLAQAWLLVGSAAQGPDLAALGARVTPARARAGEGVRVGVVVRNVGPTRAPASVVRIHLAQGALHRPVGESPVPTLAPGEEARLEVPARLPRDVREGPQWLQARVDPDGRLAPTNRQDDEAWVALEVFGRWTKDVRPRLDPLHVASPGSVAAGAPLDLRTRLLDGEGAPVDASEVEALLVSPDGSQRSLGRRPIAGGTDWAERLWLPEDLPAGPYLLRLALDPDRRLPWAEDAGPPPAVEVPLQVGEPTPGTRLRAVSLNVLATAGDRLRCEAVVANDGPAAAAGFDVLLALASLDPDRAGVWLPLEARRIAPGALGAGAQTRLAFDVARPEGLPDEACRAVLVVDPDGRADPRRGADRRAEVLVRWGASDPGAPAPGGGPSAPAQPEPTPAPVPPPATRPAPDGLPIPLVAWTAGQELRRDRGEPVTVLLAYPVAWDGDALLDLTLESRGAAWPLAEFDVPAGPAGGTSLAKGRVRLPSAVAAGPATLVVTARREDGAERPPLRVAVTIR